MQEWKQQGLHQNPAERLHQLGGSGQGGSQVPAVGGQLIQDGGASSRKEQTKKQEHFQKVGPEGTGQPLQGEPHTRRWE
eukprot:6301660-Prorocentrum_lima.AAC.1